MKSLSTSNGQIKLYIGNCIEAMREAKTEGPADLIFADPPFNIGVDYGTNWCDSMPVDEYWAFTREWLDQAYQLLRCNGALFIHVPDELVSHISVFCLTQLKLKLMNWIILHQEFGQYRESNFVVSKCHLLYLVKPSFDPKQDRPRTWNVEEVLEPSRRLRMGDKRVKDSKFKGMRPFLDVWYGPNLGRVQGNNQERRKIHPNQLPEMYLARIIRAASVQGDLVWDPFTGSGTTGTVAVKLCRRFGGAEIHERLANSAWDRIVNIGPVRDVRGPLWTEQEKELT